MKLIIKNIDNEFLNTISFEKFELYQNIIPELSTVKKSATATLINSNEKINSFELEKFNSPLRK